MTKKQVANPPENTISGSKGYYFECRGIPVLREEYLREQAQSAVSNLIQNGPQARRLFVLVMRLAAIQDNVSPNVDRLGALLTSWEDHEPGGNLDWDYDYWNAVATMSADAHSEISGSNEVELFTGEVLLGAIEEAARRRFAEVSDK
jgi:hypothetical protein